jgi:ATP adenylyltransferase
MHIVPRWSGDTNFMPVLAEVKVVSESLTNMWDQFREAFAKNPRA